MPESRPVPIIDEISLEDQPLKLTGEAISDAYALRLVKDTFDKFENWRTNNHEARWKAHDALYFGTVAQRVWEGTNIAKASLSNKLTFEHVETAMPQLMEALFGDAQWFTTTPEPGGSIEEARAVQAHLTYALEHSRSDLGLTAKNELEHAIRSTLIYGNGAILLEWDGVMNRPIVEFVDLKDIYIDPGTPTPSVDDSKATIYRRLMTVDEINNLRKDDRMNVPSRAELVYMSENRPLAQSDRTRRQQEAARKINYSPGFHDVLPLPADKQIEVLMYYSKTKIVWVFNREWVAFNDENPFGFGPFCVAPCFTVPSRFYAQSFADEIEDPQLYTQSLMNYRIDKLHLDIMPPRIRKRGAPMPPSKLRMFPGSIDEVEDPKNDVVVQQNTNTGDQIHEEISYMEQMAEKRTGINAMGMGIPRPGNVNRTKGGVDTQLNATVSRMQMLVRHIEDYLIVPMLYKMYRMVQYYTQPGDMLPALGQNEQYFEVGAEAFKAPIKIRMNGSSRMLTQAKLSGVVGPLMQAFANGQMMSSLNSIGITVDFMEFMRLIQDATGTSQAYKLIRPLTDEEHQARMAPPPQVAMQQQLAQMDQQTRLQIMDKKTQTDLQMKQMEADADNNETDERSAREVLKMIQSNMSDLMSNNPEAKKQELAIKAQEGHQKLQHAAQSHSQKLQQQEQQFGLKTKQQSMQHALDLTQQVRQHKVDQATQSQQTGLDLHASQAHHQQGINQEHEVHRQALKNTDLTNEQKLHHAQSLMESKLETEKAKIKLLGNSSAKKKKTK